MIKIIADSTCDLSDEIVEKYDISIASLTITVDGQDYQDRITIKPDDFYRLLPTLKTPPTTAMPSPAKFLNLMEEANEKGYKEILCICMSSGTSGSYQSAMIGKEDFLELYPDTSVRIHIVDSKSMSQGSGYLVLRSAILREQGATFEELVDFNETYKTNIKHFLAVDDMDNLIRSGRLGNVSAIIGKVLKINPIMSMKKGKGAIVAKVRSTNKTLRHYIEEFKTRVDEQLTDFIIIGYTSKKELAENLKAKLLNETDFRGDIYIMQMGVAVGAHVGLGGLSLFFVEQGHRHDGLIYNEMRELLEKKKEVLTMIKRCREQGRIGISVT